MKRFPVRHQKTVEAFAQLTPKTHFAAQLFDTVLEQPTALLLDLVDQKRQHHQVHQPRCQVPVVVTNFALPVWLEDRLRGQRKHFPVWLCKHWLKHTKRLKKLL